MTALLLFALSTGCDPEEWKPPSGDDGLMSQVTTPVVAIEPTTPLSGDDLTVVILSPGIASDGAPVRHRVRWFRDDTELAENADVDTVLASETQPHEAWSVQVVAVTADADSETASDEIVVENSAPDLVVTLSSVAPLSTEDLEVVADASDPDGSEVLVSYEWYRGTSLEDGFIDPVLPASATLKDEEWFCRVVATDEHGAQAEVWVGAVIQNSPPSLVGAIISPQPALSGQELSCTPIGFEDADGDEPEYAYQWRLTDLSGTGCNCHAEVPEPVLSGSFAMAGYLIACEVTPADGDAPGATVWSSEVEVQ